MEPNPLEPDNEATPTPPTPPEPEPTGAPQPPGVDMTDDYVQSELQKYRAALEQEFAMADTTGMSRDAETPTKEFFKSHVHNAAAQVVWLCYNSTSDSVRLRAAKMILDEAKNDTDSGSLADVLKGLQRNPVGASSMS